MEMIVPHFTAGLALHFAEPALTPRRHQLVPWALQRVLKPQDRSEQDVDVTRLDLLHGADVEIHQLGETFLRQTLSRPRSADVGPEGHGLGIFAAFWHAPLGRIAGLTNTARQGVKCGRMHANIRPYTDALHQLLAPMLLLLAIITTGLACVASAQDAGAAQGQAVARYPSLAKAGSRVNTRFVAFAEDAKEYFPALLRSPNWPLMLAGYVFGDSTFGPFNGSEHPLPEELAQLKTKAEKGDPKAEFYLGLIYDNELVSGIGEQQSRAEAKAWYRKSAERGLADAQYHLGLIVEWRDKDEEGALKLYLKAAQQGHLEAHCGLGIIYGNTKSAVHDEREAARWLRKAAEQGHGRAQWMLYTHYQFGEGVPQDKSEAYKWLLIAAAEGSSDAKETIEQIDRRVVTRLEITPAERVEGQRRARQFRPIRAPAEGK